MTPEQQRIAIAEACGWTRYPEFEGQDPDSAWDDKAIHDAMRENFEWLCPQGKIRNSLPDFMSDLNAMHEAEKSLPDNDDAGSRHDYRLMLMEICQQGGSAFATAAQRAEAFLRTLGKWVES